MIVVIIAGGSGTRLWPLSTPDYPKHLLSLTNERSLLQNTYARVRKVAEPQNIFVVSEASHAHHVAEQLAAEAPEGNILIEPARRGTASCFLLALNEINRRGLDNQAIFFLWSDHVIRDTRGFASTANLAAELAEKLEKIVFVGVEPTHASTGFGYMEKGDRLQNGFKNAFELKQFVEKPDLKTATQHFQSGNYLWNTGYMVTTRATLEREIQEHNRELWEAYQKLLQSDDVAQIYLEFENKVIDKALSEKVTDGLVVPGTFDWLDVGSFLDLHGASEQDESGNYLKGGVIEVEQVTNSYVRNEQELPVAVIGLDNVAVVATKNGILVTKKTYAQRVGDVSKRLKQ
ncbi:MAG TPA: mannose-1-phosphate guanylyltransferase [Candidatus Saccharimonadales bacterium]|jgi:mannose-1-phosphate guanylyltransferase/mannose-6-phosphate isomerase|nr:mannose-1-phosphate guanylyltransferase [Candidatus Saccharimonadales bacterium]